MVPTTDSTAKFDAFATEHEGLDQSLSAFRELLTKRKDARATVSTLAELSDRVMSHFDHEEQDDGFFENVIDQAPRLKKQATLLIEEHTLMANALTDLRRYVANDVPSETWWREVNARFEAFWRIFCRHERAEIDLVQEAFHDDIGEAD